MQQLMLLDWPSKELCSWKTVHNSTTSTVGIIIQLPICSLSVLCSLEYVVCTTWHHRYCMTEYLVHGSLMVITNSCLDMPDDIIHSLQLADVLARFQRGKVFRQHVLNQTESYQEQDHETCANLKKPPAPYGRGLMINVTSWAPIGCDIFC